jgi:hypothetical protein
MIYRELLEDMSFFLWTEKFSNFLKSAFWELTFWELLEILLVILSHHLQ